MDNKLSLGVIQAWSLPISSARYKSNPKHFNEAPWRQLGTMSVKTLTMLVITVALTGCSEPQYTLNDEHISNEEPLEKLIAQHPSLGAEPSLLKMAFWYLPAKTKGEYHWHRYCSWPANKMLRVYYSQPQAGRFLNRSTTNESNNVKRSQHSTWDSNAEQHPM